jgi:hypothetical protein
MDLNDEAEQAVNALCAELGVSYSPQGHVSAKMLWLDGYRAGMAATQKLAEEHFTRLSDVTT